jgi:hypothetical protein
MGELVPLQRQSGRKASRPLSFTRAELLKILGVYSRRVIAGEWRDYAIDMKPGIAIFSIFRHAADRPLYALAKAHRGGPGGMEFAVYCQGKRLKRSSSLDDVLVALKPDLRIVSN